MAIFVAQKLIDSRQSVRKCRLVTAKVSYCYLCTSSKQLSPRTGYMLMGTYVCMGTTIQEIISKDFDSTYIHRVLVIDGYLYSGMNRAYSTGVLFVLV